MTKIYPNTYFAENTLATPCLDLSNIVDCHEHLAHNIHWRFGVSEKGAQTLANDIYKIIDA